MPENPESRHVLESPLHLRKGFVSSVANTTMGEFIEKPQLKSLCPAHFYLENPNFLRIRNCEHGAIEQFCPSAALSKVTFFCPAKQLFGLL